MKVYEPTKEDIALYKDLCGSCICVQSSDYIRIVSNFPDYVPSADTVMYVYSFVYSTYLLGITYEQCYEIIDKIYFMIRCIPGGYSSYDEDEYMKVINTLKHHADFMIYYEHLAERREQIIGKKHQKRPII